MLLESLFRYLSATEIVSDYWNSVQTCSRMLSEKLVKIVLHAKIWGKLIYLSEKGGNPTFNWGPIFYSNTHESYIFISLKWK